MDQMTSEQLIAYWTFVLTLATIVLALGTTVMAIIAVISLRKAERSARFSVYRDIMNMLDETKREREMINRIIKADDSKRFDQNDRNNNPKELNDKHEEIIGDWDKIALMWEHKVVPEKFIMEYYSKAIVSSWLFFSELIYHERAHKHSGYKKKFQELFKKADEYRHKHKGESLHDNDHDR